MLLGVWVNEEEVKRLNDPYAEDRKILEEFVGDAVDLVDILHGNKTLAPRPGFASGHAYRGCHAVRHRLDFGRRMAPGVRRHD
ncbi:MAG: hypothetical protein MZU97_20490 [Bacillus subtilis]|nr:hypothetical protein [Bacillus subtilis]